MNFVTFDVSDLCLELAPNEWVYSWRSKPLDVCRLRILIDLCLGLFVWNFVFEETIHNVSEVLIHSAPSFLTQIAILSYIVKSTSAL